MKEALLWNRTSEGKVCCGLCSRRCLIPQASTGFCGVRKNIGGTLYTLNYGKACATNADPIEKKPLYHFHPGSRVFSVSAAGCNFRCLFCCNWEISQEKRAIGEDLPPKRIVAFAKESGCTGVSYTYTEPTVFFEYAYETARLAHSEGLFNTLVTNGYMTTEAIDMIAPYVDAATVDLKGGGDPKFYLEMMSVPSVDPIYDFLDALKSNRIHTEVTNLMVPEIGDSAEQIRRLSRWISTNLGEETPVHFLRFHPEYKAVGIQMTPAKTITEARKIAADEGLRFVYAGNLPGDSGENTYCPRCGSLMIERYSFSVRRWNLGDDVRCPSCGQTIPIVGHYQRSKDNL